MTYKELLSLYKADKLSADEKTQIEKDIEKQEAISDFLFENEEIPQLFGNESAEESTQTNSDFNDEKFLRMIKKSIRKAFLKTGLVVGTVILVIILATSTALPYIVDRMYYDPTKITGTTSSGNDTNKLSLDTTVYTELFTPGYYRTHAYASSDGFGEYDIEIFHNYSVNGQIKNAYGTIDKGRLTLFNDNVFKLPQENVFASEEIPGVSGYQGFSAAGKAENALRKLSDLDESDYYVTYVTFNKVMTYDELVKWSKESGITPDWCALCEKQEEGTYDYRASEIIGFNFLAGCCGEQGYDNEKYPYLNYYDMLSTIENYPKDNFSHEVMKTHTVSMLRYMLDSKDFRDLVGSPVSDGTLINLIENIEKHGLNIYGFAISAQKDTILQISKNESVSYIYTSPLS